MAGGHHEADLDLKGWQRTFNTVTLRGRLHTAYASAAIWAGIFLTVKFWPKKTKALEKA